MACDTSGRHGALSKLFAVLYCGSRCKWYAQETVQYGERRQQNPSAQTTWWSPHAHQGWEDIS